jgi:type I restriction enzyme S subunit
MEYLGIDEKILIPKQEKPLAEVAGSYTYFADGDVLLAKITPCFENGKLGIAANLTNGIGFGSSEYVVFRPGQSVDKEWLYYFLSRESFRTEGAARMSGAVGHKRVSKEFIEAYPIPLPPLLEQQRIVSILDEAFDGIATTKANAEKNLRNARALFESHLQTVFTRRGEGWVENKLTAITTKIGSGATPRGGEEAYKTVGISLIRSLNVHDMGFKYRKLAFIDDEQADGLSNVEVQSRDVLLNITGASVARCCIVPDEVLPARVNQHVSIIRPISNKLDPGFLHYLLISKPYKDQLLQTGSEGGSTRQAITKAQIQDFTVAYPLTLKEQTSTVAKLDLLRAETQRLEAIYQQKLAALDALKKSLLHQAFTGQL